MFKLSAVKSWDLGKVVKKSKSERAGGHSWETLQVAETVLNEDVSPALPLLRQPSESPNVGLDDRNTAL